MGTRILTIAAILFSTTAVGSAGTLSTTLTGNFTFDNDVVLFDVLLQTPAQLTVFTSSWASGGFATHLEMFDGTGTSPFAVSNGGVPACIPNGPAPLRDGLYCGDAEVHEGPTINDPLPAGHYLIALSQADNYSDGFDIHDPFTYDGVAGQNYTAVPGICDAYFCDSFFLTPNTSAWSVTFQFDTVEGNPTGTVTQVGAVPEPATSALLLGGAVLVACWRRRR